MLGTGGRLVAGSRNRNEFVVINADEFCPAKDSHELSGHTCQICGDEIDLIVIGDKEEEAELFVACNECAFPVCRTCYEYERREGTRACPQCVSRYKRHKGSPRVEGDEEEDDADDLNKEFNFGCANAEGGWNDTEANYGRNFVHGWLSTSDHGVPLLFPYSGANPDVPLLTNDGVEVDVISLDHHALVVPSCYGFGGDGRPPPEGELFSCQIRGLMRAGNHSRGSFRYLQIR